jgi:hypothetical protein
MLNIPQVSIFSFPTMSILSAFSVYGLFDGDPKQLPYGEIGVNQVCSNVHQEFSLDLRRHGIVFLKNDHAIYNFSMYNRCDFVMSRNFRFLFLKKVGMHVHERGC